MYGYITCNFLESFTHKCTTCSCISERLPSDKLERAKCLPVSKTIVPRGYEFATRDSLYLGIENILVVEIIFKKKVRNTEVNSHANIFN